MGCKLSRHWNHKDRKGIEMDINHSKALLRCTGIRVVLNQYLEVHSAERVLEERATTYRVRHYYRVRALIDISNILQLER